jgi:hypothetical protein
MVWVRGGCRGEFALTNESAGTMLTCESLSRSGRAPGGGQPRPARRAAHRLLDLPPRPPGTGSAPAADTDGRGAALTPEVDG